jgi:antitoxin VapB
MATTRAFRSGNSQAVRLPAEMAFEDGQELTVTRSGNMVTIVPKSESLRHVLEEFLASPPLTPSEPIERTQVPDRNGL